MGVEERGIIQLQDRQVDAGRDRDHRRRNLVAGRIRLHLTWLA